MDTDDHILDLIGLLIVLGMIAGVGILVFFGGQTGPGAPAPAEPDANWTAQRLNGTHVQLGHTGGDAVEADQLALTVDSEDRSLPWTGRVDQGTVAVVRAMEGTTITLHWDGDPRIERIELERWQV